MSYPVGSISTASVQSPTCTQEQPSLKPENKKKETKYRCFTIDTEKSAFSSLEERLVFTAIKTMQEMASDHFRRMEDYPKKISLLNEGIFYQDGLCSAMLELIESEKTTHKTKTTLKKHFALMQKSGVFHHGAAPDSHFIIPTDKASPTGKSFLRYCLKDRTITPSSALDAILYPKSRVFLSCTEACQISYLKAFQETLGSKKFDYLFAVDSPTPFFVGAAGNSTDHLMYLLTYDRVPEPKEAIKQGEWVFFNGVDNLYPLKHMNGSGGGWNTLCLNPQQGDETYIGLGLKPDGVKHGEIVKTLLSEYNKTPIGFQGVTQEISERMIARIPKEEMAYAESLKTHTLTKEKFRKFGGGKMGSIRSFDTDYIQKLIDASPEEGRLLLADWKKAFTSHVFNPV